MIGPSSDIVKHLQYKPALLISPQNGNFKANCEFSKFSRNGMLSADSVRFYVFQLSPLDAD